ncbi:PREDICTED: uncharacterized protein LOC104724730 [Camelina sativa]|uniref:Uncharacterized protein LOC104724730 n=1 Tax=Camelina sativa TaxID=90675 RepID=A0ABM0UIC3_CAMSA|nr:PREDICTED: uncharacterized protein LOC104724730 [Camelina sativa]
MGRYKRERLRVRVIMDNMKDPLLIDRERTAARNRPLKRTGKRTGKPTVLCEGNHQVCDSDKFDTQQENLPQSPPSRLASQGGSKASLHACSTTGMKTIQSDHLKGCDQYQTTESPSKFKDVIPPQTQSF